MSDPFKLLINAAYTGGAAFKKAQADVKGLQKDAGAAGAGIGVSFRAIAAGAGVAAAAFGAIALAAKAAWDTLKEGAALNLATDRFEKLAVSINSTADSMLGKLREATGGMMSDAALVASASDIMSLGLGKTEEQTVRLATVVGKLGWDMQQVILTMANNSKMRLDALGLSVEDVTARAKKLEAAGYSMDEAFDLAVMEAGEAQIALVGDAAASTAGKIQILETALRNAQDEFKAAFAAELATQVDELAGSAQELGDNLDYATEGAASLAAGLASAGLAGLSNFAKLARFEEIRAELTAMGVDITALNRAKLNIFTEGGPEAINDALAMAIKQLAEFQEAARRANPELRYFENFQGIPTGTTKASASALAEWTDEVKKANEAAIKLAEGADFNLDGITGANQSGIWAAAGAHIQGVLDEWNAKAGEAADEIAAELAEAFRVAATAASDAFTTAMAGLQDVDVPDLINLDGSFNADLLNQAIMGTAQASGAAVSQLGALGVALGEFTPEMAEAATKAALFQGALQGLTQQWVMGAIDTSGFLGAIEEVKGILADDLSGIQTQLADAARGWEPVRVPVTMEWTEGGDPIVPTDKPLHIPVYPTIASDALSDALDPLDGIQGVNTQIIFEDPDTAAFDDALETMTWDIESMPTVITFADPDTTAVYNALAELAGTRTQMYVDIVPVASGSIPAAGSGGSSGPGGSGRGVNFKMDVNFNGPVSDSKRVVSSLRSGLPELYAAIRREGVNW